MAGWKRPPTPRVVQEVREAHVVHGWVWGWGGGLCVCVCVLLLGTVATPTSPADGVRCQWARPRCSRRAVEQQ
eukprot:12916962-Prorocentrum_lima.AAC.1